MEAPLQLSKTPLALIRALLARTGFCAHAGRSKAPAASSFGAFSPTGDPSNILAKIMMAMNMIQLITILILIISCASSSVSNSFSVGVGASASASVRDNVSVGDSVSVRVSVSRYVGVGASSN